MTDDALTVRTTPLSDVDIVVVVKVISGLPVVDVKVVLSCLQIASGVLSPLPPVVSL